MTLPSCLPLSAHFSASRDRNGSRYRRRQCLRCRYSNGVGEAFTVQVVKARVPPSKPLKCCKQSQDRLMQVHLCGSFTRWVETVPMGAVEGQPGSFTVVVHLPPGSVSCGQITAPYAIGMCRWRKRSLGQSLVATSSSFSCVVECSVFSAQVPPI